MALSDEYMARSLDLFDSIDQHIEAVDENIAAMANIQDRQLATLEQISGKIGGTTGGGTGGANIDKLTGKIDELIDILLTKREGGGTEEGGGAPDVDMEGLGALGGEIGSFAKNVQASIPAFLAIKPVKNLIINTISDFVVKLSEKVDEDSLDNAKGVGEMMSAIGGSIIKFSRNMALATPLLVAALPGMLLLRLSTGLISGIAERISRKEKDIEQSTGLISKMSLSIVAFAGAIALSTVIMSSVGVEDLGSLAVLFGSLAAAIFVFDKIGDKGSDIAKGSLSIILMSGSLVLFSLGLKASVDIMDDVGLLGIGKTVLALVGIGGAFALAGKLWTNIALGAVAFAAVGLSLMLLSPSIETMAQTLDEYPHAMWQIPLTIVGIGGAFALAGIPVVAAAIGIGALALGLAGGALLLIATGVETFMDAVKGADENTGDIIKSTLKGVIEGFGQGFSGLSTAEALTLPLKIPMVGMMGLALGSFGFGLGQFKKNASGWDMEDTTLLKDTITGISEAFALAGSTEGQTKIFGFPVGENNVERGIESTMEMGENLEILATGIKKWLEMDLTKEKVNQIADNISRVLNVIPGVFATIGARERETQPTMDLFGVQLGVPFTSGDVEAGIEATEEMGSNLKNLADGILAWEKMNLSPERLGVIADNISRVLNTIPGVFASIGAREKGTSVPSFMGMDFLNPFSEGDIERGIESTRELGGTLKDLADGVLAWKTGGEAGFSKEDIPQIKDNITAILNVIPKVFAEIGKKEKETEGFWFWQEGDMERGIELVSDVADPLSSIASLMSAFKDIEDPKAHGKAVGDGIKSMLKSLSSGLVDIDDSMIERLENLMDPLREIPGLFADVNDSLQEHVDIIAGMSEDELSSIRTWSESLERISRAGGTRVGAGLGMARDITKVDEGMLDEATADNTRTVLTRQVVEREPQAAAGAAEPTTITEIKKENKKLKSLVDSLINLMNQSISIQDKQTQQLAAIRSRLDSGITTKDASPLGV